MDILTVAKAVATMLAASAAGQVTDDVGKSLGAEIVRRIRSFFGKDARAQQALSEATSSGSEDAINELAYTLKYYAERDELLASKLVEWACSSPSTVSQIVNARDNVNVAGRDINITGKSSGEILDKRISRAAKGLRSSEESTRLEAILHLERIAGDAAEAGEWAVSAQIMSHLASFIREHSHDPWPEGREPHHWAPTPIIEGVPHTRRSRKHPPLPDVVLALEVIGRRETGPDDRRYPIDLTNSNLSLALLNGLNYSNVNFYQANLIGIELAAANLSGARLNYAFLNFATANHADFRNASLGCTDFRKADLEYADLRGASHGGANFEDASTRGVKWLRQFSTAHSRQTGGRLALGFPNRPACPLEL